MFEVIVDMTICTILMWRVIGPAVMAGIILLCVLVPINGFYAGSWIKKIQVKCLLSCLLLVNLMHTIP